MRACIIRKARAREELLDMRGLTYTSPVYFEPRSPNVQIRPQRIVWTERMIQAAKER